MRWPTLVDFFGEMARHDEVFLVFDDGYRRRARSYKEVAAAACAFASELTAHGIVKGDAVVFYSENRPEWVVAFWGAILVGAVVVPIDFRASADFCRRVTSATQARLVLLGNEVDWPADTPPTCDVPAPPPSGVPAAWRLAAFDWTGCAAGTGSTGGGSVAAPDDVVEIVFTSGATADPKGVLISHRNLLATLEPIEAEIRKYRRMARPFFPLRFLNTLPLSHLFGQSVATLIPPLLPGTTVFARSHNPSDIVRLVRDERVSVLVSVPRILELLRSYLLDTVPASATAASVHEHVARRWWRFRRVHRMFGAKFWSVIVGAAPLDKDLERFWSGLGFVVIQGYGLTETAPIVSLNHPFATRGGSVGKPIAGVEVRLAADGEVLVRGPNVTRGYFNAPVETAALFEGDWLRTGDIGEIDDDGRLFIRGRRKEMIVTPEGLNVFPEDVERVVNTVAGVRESAVIGLTVGGAEQVHAVLALDSGADARAVVAEANRLLADHQRIRGVTVWPESSLPRTEGTAKLKRREIRSRVITDGGAAKAHAGASQAPDPIAAAVSRLAGQKPVDDETGLDELGLGSLDRVELIASIEQRHGIVVDESALMDAHTVADLRALVGASRRGGPAAPTPFPRWGRAWPVRALRLPVQSLLVLPLTRIVARADVAGLEHLEQLTPPVVFAANHQSHLDTPVILAALPPRWRRRLATAMAREFFAPHFHPEGHPRAERWRSSLLYYLAVAIFHGVPVPQREGGAREALRQVGSLVDAGWSILIYPEGRRTLGGEIGPFMPGVGMMAGRLGVPVVPVRLDDVHAVLPAGANQVHPGRVRVVFGESMRATANDHAAFSRRVEQAVRELGAVAGTKFDCDRPSPV